MAVKEFNCNKLKRTFWPFTLKDKVDENGNVVEKGKQSKVKVIVDPSKIGDDGLLNARIMLITDDPANSEKIIRVAGEVTK